MRRILALLLALAMLSGLCLTGCGKNEDPSVETTAATEPAATVPADGNPNDVTCKGTYTVPTPDSTVVATLGDWKLTNSLLQAYYWAAVASYPEDADSAPDFSQPLDVQECPVDGVNSWQQFFLRQALDAWHRDAALIQMGTDEGTPTIEAYQPDPEKHEKYLVEPAAIDYFYGYYSKSYKPNEIHQAYLDNLPETLDAIARENGQSGLEALAADFAGVSGDVLTEYAEVVNRAYMYFTERCYYIDPTEEDVEQFRQEHPNSAAGVSVDIRHLLVVPEGEVADDGTVTASEDSWHNAEIKAKAFLAQFNASPNDVNFAKLANVNSADRGSALNGGLYQNLLPGDLAEPLDSWCFAPERQAGDVELIRSQCGYHIVYIHGITDLGQEQARQELVAQQAAQLVQEAVQKYPVKFSFDKIQLGTAPQQGEPLTVDQLLYPDVAHERFPFVPIYLQQDYPNSPYGAYKLSSHGCGITALAMLASYMMDTEMTPHELAARYGYYCGLHGSDTKMFDTIPPELGFFVEKCLFNWEGVPEALQEGKMIITLQHAGHFTTSGHFLVLAGDNGDGTYIVRDSNVYNYRRLDGHRIDGFTEMDIKRAAAFYRVYQPKIVRIPMCARCGDLTDVPTAMFSGEYQCAKCHAALERRGNFLSICG